MITINPNSPELKTLLEQYYSYLCKFLLIQNVFPDKEDKLDRLIVNQKNSLHHKQLIFLKNELPRIIKCLPGDLKKLNSEMLNHIGCSESGTDNKDLDEFRSDMEDLYEGFIHSKVKIEGGKISIGRWLTGKLDLWVCPYCNHNYTLTVNDPSLGKGFRPDFDHFLPKSKYPLFALSFFNLIPSCTTCNKVKGNKEIFHNPYDHSAKLTFEVGAFDDQNNEILLGLSDTRNKLSISQKTNYSAMNTTTCNVNVLMLKEVYDHHVDYVNDILDKVQEYNSGHYDGIIQSFQGLGKTPGEIDRIVWSVYKDHPAKRPLSKLTFDVLKQIGL